MKTYTPTKLKTGGFHYTLKHRNNIQPLGYCGGKPPTTREEIEKVLGQNAPTEQWPDLGWKHPRAQKHLNVLERHRKVVRDHGDKFHEDGHDTREEARACYTEYLLDNRLVFHDSEPPDYENSMARLVDTLESPRVGDEVPPNVMGKECMADCDLIVAFPTAGIAGPGLDSRLRLCTGHCNEETIRDFYEVGDIVGSF